MKFSMSDSGVCTYVLACTDFKGAFSDEDFHSLILLGRTNSIVI